MLAGCGGSADVAVEVSPSSTLADRPVHLAISGLSPREVVSVDVRSTDAHGVPWRATARYRADEDGVVDLDNTPPTGGDYGGVWGMGIVVSLSPRGRAAAYAWDGDRPLRFRLSVRSRGKEVASRTFTRRLTERPLKHVRTSLATTGFAGEYVRVTEARRRPAIFVVGDAAGGLRHVALAERLAARGFPTLTIAYLGVPGVPRGIAGVRLEYFERALRWLAARPEVDRRRMFTLGIGRGSEAAMLLGVHFPELVRGVVASVPSNVVSGPSWTLGGKFVPFTLQFSNPNPVDDPRAVIPVERIRGPVFAYCAENDLVWSSCAFARAIVARRAAHGRDTVFRDSPAAGHDAGGFAPFELTSAPHSRVDEQAREQVWPRLLAFLEGAT